MARSKKSFRLELTKEQQALILQNTGLKTRQLELSENALRTQPGPGVGAAAGKPGGDQARGSAKG